MSVSGSSNVTPAAIARRVQAQRDNTVVRTVKAARKATRYRPSTLIVRRDPTIMHPAKPLCSGWAMDMMTVAQVDRSEANRVDDFRRQHSFQGGGNIRLSDLHK